MPYKCYAQANSREKVVHGTPNNYSSGRNLAFWFDIYRNVFYFHIVLGLQNLLRIWIYVVGLLYFGRCYSLCDYSLHIFPAKCRRLPMVRLFYYYFLAATGGVLTQIIFTLLLKSPWVFFISADVTVCVTIVCTYFLLNAEGYRW